MLIFASVARRRASTGGLGGPATEASNKDLDPPGPLARAVALQNSAQCCELGRDRKSAMRKLRGSCFFASHLTKAEPQDPARPHPSTPAARVAPAGAILAGTVLRLLLTCGAARPTGCQRRLLAAAVPRILNCILYKPRTMTTPRDGGHCHSCRLDRGHGQSWARQQSAPAATPRYLPCPDS